MLQIVSSVCPAVTPAPDSTTLNDTSSPTRGYVGAFVALQRISVSQRVGFPATP